MSVGADNVYGIMFHQSISYQGLDLLNDLVCDVDVEN